MSQKQYFYGLGRRKESTARARLFSGKGKITINGKELDAYLSNNETLSHRLFAPLRLIGKENDFDVTFVVKGGGQTGQIDACVLALSNAIATMNEDLRSTLKKASMLKRDAREKERSKYGLRGARKKEQFSKR